MSLNFPPLHKPTLIKLGRKVHKQLAPPPPSSAPIIQFGYLSPHLLLLALRPALQPDEAAEVDANAEAEPAEEEVESCKLQVTSGRPQVAGFRS